MIQYSQFVNFVINFMISNTLNIVQTAQSKWNKVKIQFIAKIM